MGMFGTKPPILDRKTVMAGHPVKLPAKAREEKDGKVHITVEFRRPSWQQMLGAESVCDRTFALDAYGTEVYDACDGQTTVYDMVHRFADNHKISVAEAEVAVSTFLRTLMRRGMIGVEMKEAAKIHRDSNR